MPLWCFLQQSKSVEIGSKKREAFIAFSAGPRNCIGQEFALNEEKVVIAYILRNFKLTLDTEKSVKNDFLIILRPKDGLYLKYTVLRP
ncbi:hypothetical protein EMCRGX_G019898 [Ephydatia muelleri]